MVKIVFVFFQSSCLCKQHVIGLDCSRCQLNYYNLSADNFQGCTACHCWKTGTHGKLLSCDTNSGQCFCKNTVSGRKCNKCAPGYHSFDPWNLFGCTGGLHICLKEKIVLIFFSSETAPASHVSKRFLTNKFIELHQKNCT